MGAGLECTCSDFDEYYFKANKTKIYLCQKYDNHRKRSIRSYQPFHHTAQNWIKVDILRIHYTHNGPPQELILIFLHISLIFLGVGHIFLKIFFLYSILKKVGHISPSNLCELQIRPFRPLLLTFMNRKLGGRPNICASVFFINSTDLTHYSFKIQNEIETRPISPSIRKPSRSNQLLDRDWEDLYSPKNDFVAFWSSKS